MRFDADFGAARDEEGREVRFTRSEALVLACLARQPERVLTRDQILDAMSGPGSDKADRTVDFLINRLRRKLGDSSTEPRFIATRYGEGYVWVGRRPVEPGGAAIVVGPLRGIDALGPDGPRASAFAEALRAALAAEAGAGRRVALRPDHEAGADRATAAPETSIELSFLGQPDGLDCVIAVREGATGRMRNVRRHPVGEGAPLGDLAAALLAVAWQSLVDDDALHAPLPVAMHDAAGHPEGTRLSWHDNDRRLDALRQQSPNDPALMLMRAAHLHTKYVQHGWDLFRDGRDERAQDEDEMERLVLGALDYAQDRPDQAVLAAKLLHFLQRGYRDLAFDLAEGALGGCTAPAASHATVGQLRAFRGDMESGMDLLVEAAALCRHGSEPHAWVLAQLCQTALAAGGGRRLWKARADLVAIRPKSRFGLELLLSDSTRPSLTARAAAAIMSRRRATAILRNLWYFTGRLFEEPSHAENVMRPAVTLLRARLGPEVLPAEVARGLPGLLR